MERSESIQRQFGAAAARYAVSSVHRAGPDLDAMLVEAGLRGGEDVLDIGCGPGHTALAFAARGARVVALDLTDAMLDQGRRLAAERGLDGICFQQGDVARLPFAGQRFDLVTSRLSAHHYASPGCALREVARVLRPGGRLLLVDSVAPEDPAEDTFLNAIELLRDASHVRDHRVSDWLALFAAAGLAGEQRGAWQIPIEFDDWVARVDTPAAAVASLRTLLAGATDRIRGRFGIGRRGPFSFHIPEALICGRRPG